MKILVQKYGGSSVATIRRIRHVAKRITQHIDAGVGVVAVISAIGDTTDRLISLANEVTSHPPQREYDLLLSTGEQVSISLLAMAINDGGYPVIALTGEQGGIITDNHHTRAHIKRIDSTRLQTELQAGKVVLVAGFQGVSLNGEITTLGRGGSDTTAVALAAALQAECHIYTDVSGVFTADPAVVPTAVKLKEISYEEMLELASLGAKVLQPRAVEFAKQHQVQLVVLSSFHQEVGTRIKGVKELERELIVSGVTYDCSPVKISLFSVPHRPGIAARLFQALAQEGINVDMIIQNIKEGDENDISFTISQDDLEKARQILQELQDTLPFSRLQINENIAKVSIVGAGIRNHPGVAARMFQSLGDANINIETISTSEIKISCLIHKERVKEAVQAIHSGFDLEGLNLWGEDHVPHRSTGLNG